MNALAARRRHPAAIALLILVGLLIMGGAYSFIAFPAIALGVAAADCGIAETLNAPVIISSARSA